VDHRRRGVHGGDCVLSAGSATRRDFLRISAVSAGGLVLGVRFAEAAVESLTRGEAAAGVAAFRPNAWVRIDAAGRIVLTVGKSEMGQGVRTSLPMILAEQLEVDVDVVHLEQAMPGPDFPGLGTAGSRSIRSLWLPLSRAGAAAREMLIAAAAARWGVEPSSCHAELGRVSHAASSRSIGYGQLVEAAAALPVPADPPLKDSARFRLVGRDRRRVDGPRIVSGQAVYSGDVRPPGMRFASVIRCPVAGGTLRSFDAAAAGAVPGVRLVAPIPSGLAVIADDTWAALSGREEVEKTVAWEEGENARVSSDTMRDRLAQALDGVGGGEARVLRRGGDVAAALEKSARRIRAEYAFAFQAHAPMEPLNAVADVRSDRCEIWAGTQNPNGVQEEAAKRLGLAPSAVTVNVALLGGGFGRRGTDYVMEAVEASRAAKAPVQVLWTRPDDMRHDLYHPISLHRLEAGLGADGRPLAWRHRQASVGWTSAAGRPATEERLRSDLGGAQDQPYAIPAVSAEFLEVPSPVRIGAWRAIQNNHNMFAVEGFVDELAAAAGEDPLRYRLALLRGRGIFAGGRDNVPVDRDRLARVLGLAGERAGWGARGGHGRGRGVACAVYDGYTHCAIVADASVGRERWRAERIVCAVDCGIAVNPLGIRAQVEGAVAWALSALSTRVTLKDGRVEQATYRDFPILRFRDMPAVETHIVPSDAPPTGMGEPPVPVALAAVMNALSAAAGRRLRRVPIEPDDLNLNPRGTGA
jgi:isoquinoline 1-oxidoreductase subunit beta